MAVLATICGLLAVVTSLALVAEIVPIPYPTIMVLAGLVISFVPQFPRIHLPPDYYMLIFLPPLVYAAAWAMPWRDFRLNLRPILLLAIGFVIFTAFVVGAVAHELIAGMTWAAAIAFGAIVAPTDPVAATAIMERTRAPRRLTTILEGESLVNDASGLTIFRIATIAAVQGHMTLGAAAQHATLMIAGGIGWGFIVGCIVVWIHRRIDNPMVETMISLLTPYASFLPAQAVDISGVLAVVITGLYVSWRSPHVFTPLLRLRGRAVWNVVTFALNGLTFILIGLALPDIQERMIDQSLVRNAGWAALFVAVVMAARFVWVFPSTAIPRWVSHKLRERDPMPPWRHMVVVAFTSMRGVVSLAAALSLPLTTLDNRPFPARNAIIFLTFGVILGTLVIQSILLRPLLWLLGLIGHETAADKMERDARLQATRAALHRLDQLADQSPPQDVALLRQIYQRRLQSSAVGDGHPSDAQQRADTLRTLHRQLIQAERNKLLDLYDRDVINQTMLERIAFDLDLTELRLHPEDRTKI